MAVNYRVAPNKKPDGHSALPQLAKEIAAVGGIVSTSEALTVSGIFPRMTFKASDQGKAIRLEGTINYNFLRIAVFQLKHFLHN